MRQLRARRGDVPGQSFLAVRIQRQDEVILAQNEVAGGDLVHGLVELDDLADRLVAGRNHHALGAVEHRQCVLRSEEHTSELQSLMRISYAVFFLQKKTSE